MNGGAQINRLAAGGRIARDRRLGFTFDGAALGGFGGDTLASALLANGVKTVARSFKYHRRRGIFTAGVEEPNALVTLHDGGRREPNIPATTVELRDGLRARSQHCWPSLGFDLGAIFGLAAPLLPAGFYYKTFIAPGKNAWPLFERFIRRAAGLGEGAQAPDPDEYETVNAFCDVLVVGGGAAGLAAALAAAQSGARVILCEQDFALGGALLSEDGEAEQWRSEVEARLRESPQVKLLTRAVVFGGYDHGVFAACQNAGNGKRLWRIRAGQTALAAGALERAPVFAGNDLPGVMLAQAARAYAKRWAVRVDRRTVVFTNNDSAYACAADLAAGGAEVTLIDSRRSSPRMEQCKNIEVVAGAVVARALGRRALRAVEVARDGKVIARIPCGALAVSGGFSPTLHLAAQRWIGQKYDEEIAAFVPDSESDSGFHFAGAVRGDYAITAAIDGGYRAGQNAAAACGRRKPGSPPPPPPPQTDDEWQAPISPLWETGARRGKKFVDFQHDVTVTDIAMAAAEGYDAPEHLKRYTTLGMATDQGKTANVNALAILADLRGGDISQMRATTYRPPYAPIAIGALAGAECGALLRPERQTPAHTAHCEQSAVFMSAGLWRRPRYYPQTAEETLEAASRREAANVRAAVGVADVSTLGKIEIHGPDAAAFLERIYINRWRNLAVGKVRYGAMLRDDGVVLDDGACARLEETRFFMTTTTAEAAEVLSHLEFHLQASWPDLRVAVFDATEQWAAFAIAGPQSRALLNALCAADFSNDKLPFMGVCDAAIENIKARIHRLSFSGELAFEIYASAADGEALWRRILDCGKPFQIRPYGAEALGILRIEKGFPAGAEIDGRTTLADLGLAKMARPDGQFIGGVLRKRAASADPARPTLIGLEPADQKTPLRAGAILRGNGGDASPHGEGHISSAAFSPALGRPVALGFLRNGAARKGEIITVDFPLKNQTTQARVTAPVFVDPEGKRPRG